MIKVVVRRRQTEAFRTLCHGSQVLRILSIGTGCAVLFVSEDPVVEMLKKLSISILALWLYGAIITVLVVYAFWVIRVYPAAYIFLWPLGIVSSITSALSNLIRRLGIPSFSGRLGRYHTDFNSLAFTVTTSSQHRL